MDIPLSGTPCAIPRTAPHLYRRGNGHLGLRCGPSRRRKLKVWMLLRLRYGFRPLGGGDEQLLVWGNVRLRVLDGQGLVLVSDSDLADALLRSLCGEL